MTTLSTKDLKVGYGNKSVLSGLNIYALSGKIVGILGSNGSGKTTVLRTISGLLAPLGGRVEINQKDLKAYSQMELARTLALVLTGQQFNAEFLTSRMVVAAGRYPYTGFMGNLTDTDEERVTEAIKLVHVEDLTERFFLELSDGERQKIMLARALAQETKLIILDEPTSFLDLKNRSELMQILRRLCQERKLTVLLSLHDLEIASKYCDQVILVKDGAVLSCGTPEEVISASMVNQLYDLDNLNYSLALGQLELLNANPSGIFVVAGNCSGAEIYRLLTKYGYGFTTGVLHQNDLDYQVAQTMEVKLIDNPPFDPIENATLSAALEELSHCHLVIDAGFSVGTINQANLELLNQAEKMGKSILALNLPTKRNASAVLISIEELLPALAARLD